MSVEGPLSPTGGSSSSASGLIAWTNPGNIVGSDNATADSYASSFYTLTHELVAAFTAASVSGTVNSISVGVEARAENTGRAVLKKVWLAVSGTLVGSVDTTESALTESDATYTRTSFGSLPSAAQLTGGNFQVRVQCGVGADTGGTNVFVDHITLTIDYTEGGGGGSGSVTLVGRGGRLFSRLVR